MILQVLKNNYKIKTTLGTPRFAVWFLCYFSILGRIIYISTSGMMAQPPQVPCI